MGRCAAVLVLLALPLRAEIYRCENAAGALHFTSDPAACDSAVVHTPRVELQRGAPGLLEEVRAPGAADEGELRPLFAPAPAGWEAIEEPVEPAHDPALRAHGLRASQVRHYTRVDGPVTEVCSVELWRFASARQAATVAAGFEREGWYRTAVGELLVVAHGARLEREVGSAQGLVSGCRALAELTRARAAERLAPPETELPDDSR